MSGYETVVITWYITLLLKRSRWFVFHKLNLFLLCENNIFSCDRLYFS